MGRGPVLCIRRRRSRESGRALPPRNIGVEAMSAAEASRNDGMRDAQ